MQGKSQTVSEFEQFLVDENRPDSLRYTEAKLYGIDSPVPVIQRVELPIDLKIEGPALITETVSTTYIETGWQCCADRFGNLMLQKLD